MIRMDHARLIQQWRRDVDFLRRHGALEAAATKEQDVADLEAFIRDDEQTELTLEEASNESGYSAAHLTRLLSTGALANVGRRGAPRVRRRDLPKKPPSSARVAKAPSKIRQALGLDPSGASK
jgi:ribose 1,5-bisphosphokinase PhnN